MYRLFVYYDNVYDCFSETYDVFDINPNDFDSSLKFIEYLSLLCQGDKTKCKRLEIIFDNGDKLWV